MIDRKILIEKMQQFGIDWIGSSGFLDEGQVNHVLDIVEKESGLTPRALDSAFCTCGMFMDSGRTEPATCEFCGKPQSQ